jgi:YHS domain-containing protein
MKRLFAVVAFAVAVLAAPFGWTQGPPDKGEEMAIDPVCQMNIPKAKAPFSKAFQGETFYFCNQFCAKSFDENPTKYASSVQKCRDYEVSYAARSGKLHAKEPTTMWFRLKPMEKDGKRPGWKPTGVEATCEISVEGRPQPISTKLKFDRMKEEDCFGGNVNFPSAGHVTIRVKITFDDGNFDEVVFKAPVIPGEGEDTGHEYDGKRMDMIIQHETMRKIGKYWAKAGSALEAGNLEEAKKAFALVKNYQRYIDQMVPHVFEDELDEFKSINLAYGKALAEMEGVLGGGDVVKSLESWTRVDALHCTECHMKFRWSTFSDLKNYPVVGGEEGK